MIKIDIPPFFLLCSLEKLSDFLWYALMHFPNEKYVLRPVSTQGNNPRIGSEQNLTCTCAFGANSLPSLKQFCTCEQPTSN